MGTKRMAMAARQPLSPKGGNVMIETISMDHGALKETVTMDYGQPSTLGMVAARKAAIEGRSKENVRSSAPSDTLGFAKMNDDAAAQKIAQLQAMVEREARLRQQAEAKSLSEQKARVEAEQRAADREAAIKERERALLEKSKQASTAGSFKIQQSSLRDERFNRACNGFKYRSQRTIEQKQQREARMEAEAGSLHIPPATPPRCAVRGYSDAVCSPSVGRDERRGMRTPGARCESMAPGSSAYRRAPWRGSMPRRASQSVSMANWTADHARIARERAVKLGVQKTVKPPRNPGQPQCSFYQKHGYCNTFETKGRCAFDHNEALLA